MNATKAVTILCCITSPEGYRSGADEPQRHSTTKALRALATRGTRRGRTNTAARTAEKSRLFGVKRSHLRGCPGQAQFLPARSHPVMDGFAQQGGLRKLAEMLMRLAGVDEHLGTVRPSLERKPAGIEPGRPGVAQDVDVFRRMAARAQRPKHVVDFGRVDVLVDDNDPFRVVGGGRTLRSERQHLR